MLEVEGVAASRSGAQGHGQGAHGELVTQALAQVRSGGSCALPAVAGDEGGVQQGLDRDRGAVGEAAAGLPQQFPACADHRAGEGAQLLPPAQLAPLHRGVVGACREDQVPAQVHGQRPGLCRGAAQGGVLGPGAGGGRFLLDSHEVLEIGEDGLGGGCGGLRAACGGVGQGRAQGRGEASAEPGQGVGVIGAARGAGGVQQQTRQIGEGGDRDPCGVGGQQMACGEAADPGEEGLVGVVAQALQEIPVDHLIVRCRLHLVHVQQVAQAGGDVQARAVRAAPVVQRFAAHRVAREDDGAGARIGQGESVGTAQAGEALRALPGVEGGDDVRRLRRVDAELLAQLCEVLHLAAELHLVAEGEVTGGVGGQIMAPTDSAHGMRPFSVPVSACGVDDAGAPDAGGASPVRGRRRPRSLPTGAERPVRQDRGGGVLSGGRRPARPRRP